jgi:hypothetical protein
VIAVAGAVAACAILFAGTGAAAQPTWSALPLAASKPSLGVYAEDTHLARTAGTDLEIFRPSGSSEVAQLTIFVPQGFDLGLLRPIGTRIGLMVAWEVTGQPHFGDITIDDPAKHAADSCSPGPHQAVWTLDPEGLGQLPAYIDPTSGSETALGSYKIVICLPSSATSLLTLNAFDLDPTIRNPGSSGLYMWRVFVTPYAGGAPNPSGTYELRAREPLPVSLSLRGRYRRGRAVLTGRLVTPAMPTAGIYVAVFADQRGEFRRVASIRTGSGGRYSFSRRIRKATRFAAQVASIRACQEATTAPAGCVSEGMVSATSSVIRIRVPRRR